VTGSCIEASRRCKIRADSMRMCAPLVGATDPLELGGVGEVQRVEVQGTF
jgi:hypothetical protein